MNENNSTESTVLSLPTHLPVLSNSISTSKPSSMRPPFPLFTHPPSPLFLPSQLAQFIPSAFCHNNITCAPLQLYVTQPIFFTSDLPSSSFTSILIQGIIPEAMAANTSISESIFTDPQFQAPYVMPMPNPKVPGSPFFEGDNISYFLKKFENMCEDYQMSTSEKIRCLPWYCEMFIARHVRSVGFSRLDWIKISTNLKKKYKNRNIAQQISSRIYLEAFKDKPRTKSAKVLHFCCDYLEISKELLSKKKLDKYTQFR